MARKKRRRIASRGSVNTIILKTLINGDKYGYDIIKQIEEESDGKIKLKQPSLYSSLSRFEEKGIVSSYWGDSDIGGRRHYYHLTELGQKYYQRVVLKIDVDDNFSNNNDIIEDNVISDESSEEDVLFDEDNDIDDENDKFDEDNEEEFSDTNKENNNAHDENDDAPIILSEIDDKEIPSLVDFENKNESTNEVIIPDHNFHTPTPIEKKIDEMSNENIQIEEIFNNESPQSENLDNDNKITYYHSQINTNIENIQDSKPETYNNNNITSINSNEISKNYETATNSYVETYKHIDEIKPWEKLSNHVKENNKSIANSPNQKFHYIKPKKSQIVILDKDGIYKLRDSDYKPEENNHKNSNKIIDNVKKRTNGFDIFSYNKNNELETIISQKKEPIVTELSEEERKKRNQDFLEKFNKLTQSLIEEKNANKPIQEEKVIEQPKKEEVVDYRNKLDKIIQNTLNSNTTNSINQNDFEDDSDNYNEDDNNLFNYTDDSDEYLTEEDDKFIDFEDDEPELERNTDTYAENIINTPTQPQEQVQINTYRYSSNYTTKDRSYVLINKVKMIFGFILLALMLLETTLSLIVFKNSSLIMKNDKKLFVFAYIISVVLGLIFILPYMFNTHERKLNNFKYKISVPLGVLTFIILTILIYCINALMGFDLNNLNYFAVKMFLPMILSFNFVISPIIYGLIINNKNFYD